MIKPMGLFTLAIAVQFIIGSVSKVHRGLASEPACTGFGIIARLETARKECKLRHR